MVDKAARYQIVFNSKGDGQLLLPTKPRSKPRKRYTEERRKEVVITRKIGACDRCRRRRVRCTHHVLAPSSHSNSKTEPPQGFKCTNADASSVFDIDNRGPINMTGEAAWDSTYLEASIEPPQATTTVLAAQHTNLLSSLEGKRQPSVDSADTLRPCRKTFKMDLPNENSIDDQVLSNMVTKNSNTLSFENNLFFSTRNNQAGNLGLGQNSSKAALLQDVGSTPLDTWMAFSQAPNVEVGLWIDDDTSVLDKSYSTMNFGLNAEMFIAPQGDVLIQDLSLTDSASFSQHLSQYKPSHFISTLSQVSRIEDENIDLVISSQIPVWHQF